MSSSPRESAAALKARALRLLARREHSRDELARRLSPYAESAESLRGLLRELEGGGQLSNERFAESRARVLARKYGPARIRQDLRAKGVAADVVAVVIGTDELERARGILARRYRTAPRSREERARRARFLHGRGFSADIIHRLLLREEQ
ncbi:MAG TPA: recombination regulator RecX [Burkholderiales bacterium]|nr:recombination regulator RecX [Burkholderiales bacterium]